MDAKNGWKWPAFFRPPQNRCVWKFVVFLWGGIHWNLSKRFVWDRVNGFETKLVDFVTPLICLKKTCTTNHSESTTNWRAQLPSCLYIYIYMFTTDLESCGKSDCCMFWLTVSGSGGFLTSLGAKVKKSVCQQYYSVDLANAKKQNASSASNSKTFIYYHLRIFSGYIISFKIHFRAVLGFNVSRFQERMQQISSIFGWHIASFSSFGRLLHQHGTR